MKDRYIILGTFNDENRHNLEILDSGNNKKEIIETYKKLQRINDLQFPETQELSEERNKLMEELEHIFISDDECEWDLKGIFEVKQVKI